MRVLRSLSVIFVVILAVVFPWQVSQAATVTLNFTSTTGGCVDASAYLKSFGITFVATTAGATAQMCGPQPPSILSGFFFIGPPVTNTPVSGDLLFSNPVSQVGITLAPIDPATSIPAWDALAFNTSGASVGLSGSGITRLHFDAFNTGGNSYNFPPIDHITLTTGTSGTLTITSTSVPAAAYNVPYTFSFQASGGTSPYTWAATAENNYAPINVICTSGPTCFPPGLKFTPDGTISPDSSTDLVSGTYNLTVTVTDSTGTSYTAPSPLPLTVSCGFGQLDTLTELYRTYAVRNVGAATLLTYVRTGDQFIPPCSSITQTAHSLLYPFTSQFLAGGEPYTWALIRNPLTLPAVPFSFSVGLDSWVTVFSHNTASQGKNYGPRLITSGYRDPQYNHTRSPNYPNGRHQFGDAIDLNNNSWDTFGNSPQSLAEYWEMSYAAYIAGARYVEPWSAVANNSLKGHAHADWRDTPGPYQQ